MNKKKQSNAPKNLNADKMRQMYLNGYCMSAIARHFKCQLNAVTHHLSDLIIPTATMHRSNSKLTSKDVIKIRRLYIKSGYPATILAPMFKVSESSILNIIHGVYYRWVPGEAINRSGMIYTIPEVTISGRDVNKMGMKKSGPNENTVRRVHSGALIPLAKKYGVATCTISRWIKKGKLKAPKVKK